MTADRELHPDYLDAGGGHRWGAPLFPLIQKLEAESVALAKRTPDVWAWRVLPQGAFVGVQHDAEAGTFRLRIARRDKPEGERGRKAWDFELRTFLRCFRLEGLNPRRYNEAEAKGVAVIFTYADDGRT